MEIQSRQPMVRDLIPEDVIREVRLAIGNMSGIVEVSTLCNLACDYCFAERPSPSIMSVSVAERIVVQLLKHNGVDAPTKFIWHGGEPLLAGIGFFQKVLAFQERMALEGYRSVNAIQTNATLLNDEWVDFLRDHSFGVGSSLDGLQTLHDARRVDPEGKGTYDAVVSNLSNARDRGLRVGVICVLTADGVPYIEYIYRNMKALDLPFTMSPVTPNPGAGFGSQPLTPEEYADALIRLFDCWFDDPDPTIIVNPPHSVLMGILYGGLPLYCSADDSCLTKFVSFLPDGSTYPCNRFAGNPDFLLGNIASNNLHNLLNAPPRQSLLLRTKDNIASCSACDNGTMCRGGCAYHAYSFHADVMKADYYCKAFFKAFDYYKGRLESSLREAALRVNMHETLDCMKFTE